jgi:hypothetical protein
MGLAAGLLFFEGRLEAYTDPGSGAMLWQLLVGAFFGAMYVVRRVLARFSGRKSVEQK